MEKIFRFVTTTLCCVLATLWLLGTFSTSPYNSFTVTEFSIYFAIAMALIISFNISTKGYIQAVRTDNFNRKVLNAIVLIILCATLYSAWKQAGIAEVNGMLPIVVKKMHCLLWSITISFAAIIVLPFCFRLAQTKLVSSFKTAYQH